MSGKVIKSRYDKVFKAKDRIKNCPFCGSTADLWLSESRLNVFVECDNIDCMARGGSGINIMEVIDKWNNRAEEVEKEDVKMENKFKLEVVVKGCDEECVLYHFIFNNIRARELSTSIIFITDHVQDLVDIRVTREN